MMRPIAMLLMVVAVAFPLSSEGGASSPSPAARPQIPRRQQQGHRGGGGGLATTGTTAALVSSKTKHALPQQDTAASASDALLRAPEGAGAGDKKRGELKDFLPEKSSKF